MKNFWSTIGFILGSLLIIGWVAFVVSVAVHFAMKFW